MNKNLATAVVIAGMSGAAHAAPFNSFDPRSMAMGSAAVAVPNIATAPFFNPSLLSVIQGSDRVAAQIPILGARVYDPEDLLGGFDDFQSADLVGRLGTQLPGCSAGNCGEVIDTATALAHDPDQGFPAVTDKEVQGELGAALIIGIPGKRWGAVLAASSWAALGGTSYDTDQATLDALIADASACHSGDAAGCAAVSAFNTDALTSYVHVKGVILSEVGVALSREIEILGAPVALGVTPKFVKATTFAYKEFVNEASRYDIKDDNHINEQSNVNLDVGLARDFTNGWRFGVVVKNLVPQEYSFKYRDSDTLLWVKDGSMKLEPQARAGISYDNGWLLAALDVDLTENNPVGLENKTRYIALGAEMDAAEWAQLRLGYRADTVNAKRSVASAGIGVSPFGVDMDLALAGNANELGVAFQMGFLF